MDETQFLILSPDRNEILVRREGERLTLPGIFADQEENSLINLACGALRKSSPVFPVAVVWSESQECIVNLEHCELEKRVILMSWTKQISNLDGFEWHPINHDVDIYHQFEHCRLRIAKELHLSNQNHLAGLPWNSYGWYSFVCSYVESSTKSSLLSVKDVRFSPCGVVLEVLTSVGKFYFKACHPSSAEPIITKLLSSVLPRYCNEVFHANVSQCCFLMKDHGPSVFAMIDLAVAEEGSSLLASMQISSISLVDQLLELGVLDARPEKFGSLFSKLPAKLDNMCEKMKLMTEESCELLKFYDNLPTYQRFLMERLETIEHYPPVLLHNDITSGNLYRANDGRLKMFDFGSSVIGHPFMEMSFRLMPQVGLKAFIQTWREAGYSSDDPASMVKLLVPYGFIVRLFELLGRIEGAQLSEIERISPLIIDTCSLLNSFLPKDFARKNDTVTSSGSGSGSST